MEMVEAWVAFFCLAMAFRAIEILSNHKHLASSHTSPSYQYGKSKRESMILCIQMDSDIERPNPCIIIFQRP